MKRCPTIIAWSPYGKHLAGEVTRPINRLPFNLGVHMDELSALQKWKGPDPAFWVAQGYAIVYPDSCGSYMSEGNVYTWGTQEDQDGADVVDAIGAKSWCNGKVGLSGKSWLSISQWFTASQRPKHLAAIAPGEGFQDLYRDLFMVGGVPTLGAFNFGNGLLSRLAGPGAVENTPAMLLLHPLGSITRIKEQGSRKFKSRLMSTQATATRFTLTALGTPGTD